VSLNRFQFQAITVASGQSTRVSTAPCAEMRGQSWEELIVGQEARHRWEVHPLRLLQHIFSRLNTRIGPWPGVFFLQRHRAWRRSCGLHFRQATSQYLARIEELLKAVFGTGSSLSVHAHFSFCKALEQCCRCKFANRAYETCSDIHPERSYNPIELAIALSSTPLASSNRHQQRQEATTFAWIRCVRQFSPQ
jgi:hypothetical protein